MLQLKLGTTNENYDRWLSGFTPYYTAVCWFGFDMNESINYNNKNPAGLFWSSVMKQIHKDLPAAKFEMSDGIVTRTICRDSGKIANSSCPNTFTEYFLKDTIPDTCTQHSGSNLNNKSPSKPTTTHKNNTTTQNTEKPQTTENTTNTFTPETEVTPPPASQNTIENSNTIEPSTNSSTTQENNTVNTTESLNNTIDNVINSLPTEIVSPNEISNETNTVN